MTGIPSNSSSSPPPPRQQLAVIRFVNLIVSSATTGFQRFLDGFKD